MAYAPYQYSYTPTYTTQPYQAPQYTQQGGNSLLWVQGESGAKSYLVAPNTTVLLMDSEAQKFYLKSTDGSGLPNLRTFEYKEIVPNVPQPLSQQESLDDKYVTREEYAAIREQYEEIIKKLSSLEVKEKPKQKAKGEIDNE